MVGFDRDQLQNARRVARGLGWRVVPAVTPLEAIVKLRDQPIDVAICARQLSSANGAALLELIAEEWPTVWRVLAGEDMSCAKSCANTMLPHSWDWRELAAAIPRSRDMHWRAREAALTG